MPETQTVLLHHTTPDPAESHFDWMILQPAHGFTAGSDAITQRCLLTFRLGSRLDHLELGEALFSAYRLENHRLEYLTYEGPVRNNRGSVTRVNSGSVRWIHYSQDAMSVDVYWHDQSSGMRYEIRLNRAKERDQADFSIIRGDFGLPSTED